MHVLEQVYGENLQKNRCTRRYKYFRVYNASIFTKMSFHNA